ARLAAHRLLRCVRGSERTAGHSLRESRFPERASHPGRLFALREKKRKFKKFRASLLCPCVRETNREGRTKNREAPAPSVRVETGRRERHRKWCNDLPHTPL